MFLAGDALQLMRKAVLDNLLDWVPVNLELILTDCFRGRTFLPLWNVKQGPGVTGKRLFGLSPGEFASRGACQVVIGT
ncbi:MAG: hypothetical protein CM1200mP30_27420 [Pseudomonadota bacterium]|nr:MAG: hypothetical protein CM1200mP30_27420 [Pseudomonadota bacterium]